MAIFCAFIIVASPLIFAIVLNCKFKDLSKDNIKDKFGVLYSDVRLSKGKGVIFVRVNYLLRRIVLAAIIVFQNNFIA